MKATEKLLPEIHWQIWPNLHPFCFGGAINTVHKKRRKTLHSPQCWQRANPQCNSFYLPSTGSSFLGRSLSNPSALPGRLPLCACESIQQHHPQKGEKLVSLAQYVSLILPTGQQKFVGVVFLFPPVRHMVEVIFWSRSSQPAGLMQSQWATSMASVCAADSASGEAVLLGFQSYSKGCYPFVKYPLFTCLQEAAQVQHISLLTN